MGLIRTKDGWRSEKEIVNDQLLQEHFPELAQENVRPGASLPDGGAERIENAPLDNSTNRRQQEPPMTPNNPADEVQVAKERPQWAMDRAYEILCNHPWGWEENASDELAADQERHQIALADELVKVKEEQASKIARLEGERLELKRRETNAFDAIFHRVPELCDEAGNELSVAGKIRLLDEQLDAAIAEIQAADEMEKRLRELMQRAETAEQQLAETKADLSTLKERAIQALMVLTDDQKRALHHQTYVDEIAKVANEVFKLNGCCHWETVCEAIEKQSQQLAASKSEAAHLRAANADLEGACRGFQEQLAAALKRAALADGLAEAVRDEVNFQNCCLNPEPIMYLDELLAALADYTKGPTA